MEMLATMNVTRAMMNMSSNFSSTDSPLIPTEVGDDWAAGDVLDLSTDTNLQNFIEFKIANVIDFYYSPIISSAGILANTWAFAILISATMRKSTTCQYMAALSIADSLILVYNLLFMIRKFPGYEVFNAWSCKLIFFAFYYTIHFDVAVMVAMTIEKYLAVKYPLQAASWKPRTKLIISIIAVVALMLDFHSLITRGMVKDPNTGMESCLPTNEQNEFFVFKVYPWIDAAVYCFAPLSILFVVNILIITTLRKSSKLRGQMANPDSTATDGAGAKAEEARKSKDKQITRMLLLVSFAFLIFVGPMAIMIIVERNVDLSSTPHQTAVYHLARTIINNLMYTNHSLNFLLYCLSAKRFRDALKDSLFFLRNQKIKKNGRSETVSSTKQSALTVSS